MKTWGGRFSQPPAELAADYGQSVDVDRALAADDLAGSIAHVEALHRAGLLSEEECTTLVGGLEGLLGEVMAGRIDWDPALEDVHMNLEAALEARVGPLARRLHTGRSRNDQVATDLRLWLRRAIDGLDDRVVALERALVGLALAHPQAVMPGHTHTQPAQPVLFAHHLLAGVEMLERDRGRLADARRRANLSPLGSGAIAGSGFALDRERVAAELGFDGVTRNSIDATGDRDFVVETIAAAALAMTHLSRMAEEIVWWSHPQLGFVRPADAFSTGSSMLPNKRNPDPAELVRGRASRVIGQLAAVLALVKGLPLGYQRDLQEDKPALFDAVATLDQALEVMAGLFTTLVVNEERMAHGAAAGHGVAMSVAEAMVEAGVAFRDAHQVVGRLVADADSLEVSLADLPDQAIRDALAASDHQAARALAERAEAPALVREAATVERALARCDVIGGTARHRVEAELRAATARLGMV